MVGRDSKTVFEIHRRVNPYPLFFLSFSHSWKQHRSALREVGQGRALFARRGSGRSETESLDEPPALPATTLPEALIL